MSSWRLDIHKFDLVGVVKHGIGDTLPHEHAGDGGNGVIQTFDVLDIHRCVDIDACFQKLLDILIPFGVAAAVALVWANSSTRMS